MRLFYSEEPHPSAPRLTASPFGFFTHALPPMHRHLKRSRGVICREVLAESNAMVDCEDETRRGKGVGELKGVGGRCQNGAGTLQLGEQVRRTREIPILSLLAAPFSSDCICAPH